MTIRPAAANFPLPIVEAPAKAGSGASSPYLSFVVPVYGSPDSLEMLCERVRSICDEMNVTHELILVDDRCPKNSWRSIQHLATIYPAVVGIRLSRNFGQHAAIQAGLTKVRGEWIVVMDCDLQDRPEEVPRLLAKAREGFEIVRAKRVSRNDPWHRRAISKLFYVVLSYLTDTHQNSEVANFGVYHRKVINAITLWQEESKYFPAIVPWIGFAQTELPVAHAQRFAGKSSYNLAKLIKLGLDVIIGFSDKPLRLVTGVGLLVAIFSFAMSFAVLLCHFAGLITVEGWTSVVLSLWFLAGCLLFALGLTGLYVGRILVETKGRPTFIVDAVISHDIEGSQ